MQKQKWTSRFFLRRQWSNRVVCRTPILNSQPLFLIKGKLWGRVTIRLIRIWICLLIDWLNIFLEMNKKQSLFCLFLGAWTDSTQIVPPAQSVFCLISRCFKVVKTPQFPSWLFFCGVEASTCCRDAIPFVQECSPCLLPYVTMGLFWQIPQNKSVGRSKSDDHHL